MKTHRKRLMLLGAIAALATTCAGAVGFSLAAYRLNQVYNDNPLLYNYGSLNSYFDVSCASNTGTSVSSPYIISTYEHLQNLQKLTAIGAFDSSSYFLLNNDIDCTDETVPLLPIGTDDSPFQGTFNGNGKKISKLVVDGNNTPDVGMFGYVGINGRVKNFILEYPTINVGANDGGGTANSMNPLYSAGSTAASSLGDLSDYTLGGTGTTSFTVPASSVTIDGTSVPVHYSSSDTGYLTPNSDGTVFTTVSHSGDSTISSTDIHGVQIEAKIYGKKNGIVCSFVLERWQINVNKDGSVNKENTDIGTKGFFKTVCVDDSGNSGYHGTYVGFFVGHLDGGTSYLGLYGGNSSTMGADKAQLIINGRSFRSYSCLIGKSRSDNPADESASDHFAKYLDLTGLSSDYTPSNGYNIPTTNSSYSVSNSYNRNQNAITASKGIGLSDTTTPPEINYLRFYPGFSGKTSISYYPSLEDKASNKTTTSSVVRFTGPLKGSNVYSGSVLWTSKSSTTTENAIWFYTSVAKTAGWRRILTSSTYDITFKIKYVASCTDFTDNVSNDCLQVIYEPYDSTLDDNASHWFSSACYDGDYWQSVSSITNNGQSAYTPIPLIDNSGLETGTSYSGVVQEKEVKMNLTSSNFNFASLFGTATWYPVFALGVGQGSVQTVAGSNTNYSSYFAADSFTLDVLSFEVLVNATDGNMSTLTNNVDYLYDDSSASAIAYDATLNNGEGSFGTWNKASGNKISFNLTDTNASKYAFSRGTSGLAGTSTTTYGFYSNTTYPLANEKNYTAATLSNATW